MLKLGMAQVDITPRVGVELCGFGPFLYRHSIGVRDRLWARAMAVVTGDSRVILVTCDLPGIAGVMTRHVREIVSAHTGIAADAIMIACSHTHSAPSLGTYTGWGEADPVYTERLPFRIARACMDAFEKCENAWLAHAEVPCEGIGLNREYDEDAQPLERVLKDGWRPAKPELTDTTCHVVTAHAEDRLLGFMSYFGCHPVVCCRKNRYIHGDYCGVATNAVAADTPGAVGLFLQGANGDVNTCVVHKEEEESLAALDIIAARYAAAIRKGIEQAAPLEVPDVTLAKRMVTFSHKNWDIKTLRALLAEHEDNLHSMSDDPTTGDENHAARMSMVYAISLRALLAKAENGMPLNEPTELQGFRIGPIGIFASGFETFQAIKNDVVDKSHAPVPLVVSMANESVGYAPDKTAAARGGYAADLVPIIGTRIPYANVHEELVDGLLELDKDLFGNQSSKVSHKRRKHPSGTS